MIASNFSEDRRLDDALGVSGVGVEGGRKDVRLEPSSVGAIALLALALAGKWPASWSR